MTCKCNTCDSCGSSVTGYTKRELLNAGWKWHAIPSRKDTFVVCGDCEARYAELRKLHEMVGAE